MSLLKRRYQVIEGLNCTLRASQAAFCFGLLQKEIQGLWLEDRILFYDLQPFPFALTYWKRCARDHISTSNISRKVSHL